MTGVIHSSFIIECAKIIFLPILQANGRFLVKMTYFWCQAGHFCQLSCQKKCQGAKF